MTDMLDSREHSAVKPRALACVPSWFMGGAGEKQEGPGEPGPYKGGCDRWAPSVRCHPAAIR